METKKEKLKYSIAKDLYQKAKESIDPEHKDALPHPSEWLDDKNNLINAWKDYLQTTTYTRDDPFSIYMNFMYRSYS